MNERLVIELLNYPVKKCCLAPDFPSNMPAAAINIIPPELMPNSSKRLLAPPLLNKK